MGLLVPHSAKHAIPSDMLERCGKEQPIPWCTAGTKCDSDEQNTIPK